MQLSGFDVFEVPPNAQFVATAPVYREAELTRLALYVICCCGWLYRLERGGRR